MALLTRTELKISAVYSLSITRGIGLRPRNCVLVVRDPLRAVSLLRRVTTASEHYHHVSVAASVVFRPERKNSRLLIVSFAFLHSCRYH